MKRQRYARGLSMTLRPSGVVASVALLLVVSARAGAGGQTPAPARTAVVPFTIHVPDDALTDLKRRLAQTRFPDELTGAGWDYGTNLQYLKELVAYWRDTFDWRAQERRLNEFEQFKTNIDGLDIHFIHRKSSRPDAMPIVLSHGWPGSFVEFTKVVGPLTDPVKYGGRAEDSFHVVVVSLPGFGFSDKPTERGYTPERMAGAVAKLMARLGYTRYGAQGGDWGSRISRYLAINDASHVAGLHLNFCQAAAPPGTTAGDPAGATPAELKRMAERGAAFAQGRAYFDLQSTKPQSLGYGLNDSPAGLAAWMVEKFQGWSDTDGNVERKFTKDELLTNITLYWLTQTATSAARIYYEQQHAAPKPDPKITVPTACALFPKELILAPRSWFERGHNLVRWTEMPRGGHFAAMEEPGLLVDDIRAFFRNLR